MTTNASMSLPTKFPSLCGFKYCDILLFTVLILVLLAVPQISKQKHTISGVSQQIKIAWVDPIKNKNPLITSLQTPKT